MFLLIPLRLYSKRSVVVPLELTVAFHHNHKEKIVGKVSPIGRPHFYLSANNGTTNRKKECTSRGEGTDES